MIKGVSIALCLTCAACPAFAAGRGYLGVWFANLPATERREQAGVVVNKVFADSAAQRAGLKPGEIVTRIDGVSVGDPRTAVSLVSENAAGERVSLTVVDKTGGGMRQFNVVATLSANPPDEFASIMTAKPKPFVRHAASSSTRHCVGTAAARDRFCRADVVAEH